MHPFIGAKCIVLHDNKKLNAIVTEINSENNTFSVDYSHPETGKLCQMLNIPFDKFHLILYYVGLGWVKENYVYRWLNDGKEVFTNDGTTRSWESVKNAETDLFIDKKTVNGKVIGSYMSKMV